MIGTLKGEGPGRARIARVARHPPQFDDQVAETVHDGRVLAEIRSAVDISDGADPLSYAIELSELPLERRKDRETRYTCSVVGLVDTEVAPDEPLHERRRPVERPVPGDVGKIVVNLDELKVARRDERSRESQAELFELTLNSAHPKEA